MSTKTLRKRIALVAVSALGFGLLSVAPSSAAVAAITLAAPSAATKTTVANSAITLVATSTVDADDTFAFRITTPYGILHESVSSAAAALVSNSAATVAVAQVSAGDDGLNATITIPASMTTVAGSYQVEAITVQGDAEVDSISEINTLMNAAAAGSIGSRSITVTLPAGGSSAAVTGFVKNTTEVKIGSAAYAALTGTITGVTSTANASIATSIASISLPASAAALGDNKIKFIVSSDAALTTADRHYLLVNGAQVSITAATAATSNEVVWDVPTLAGTYSVRVVTYLSPDGTTVASAGNAVRTFDNTVSVATSTSGVASVDFPDTGYTLTAANDGLYTSSVGATVTSASGRVGVPVGFAPGYKLTNKINSTNASGTAINVTTGGERAKLVYVVTTAAGTAVATYNSATSRLATALDGGIQYVAPAQGNNNAGGTNLADGSEQIAFNNGSVAWFTPAAAGVYTITIYHDGGGVNGTTSSRNDLRTSAEAVASATVTVASDGLPSLSGAVTGTTTPALSASGVLVKLTLANGTAAANLGPNEVLTLTAPTGSSFNAVSLMTGSSFAMNGTASSGVTQTLTSANFNGSGVAYVKVGNSATGTFTVTGNISGGTANGAAGSFTFSVIDTTVVAGVSGRAAVENSTTDIVNAKDLLGVAGAKIADNANATWSVKRGTATTVSATIATTTVQQLYRATVTDTLGLLTGMVGATYDITGGTAITGTVTKATLSLAIPATTSLFASGTTVASMTVITGGADEVITITAADSVAEYFYTNPIATSSGHTIRAGAATTNKFTVSVTDQFGNAIAGVVMTAAVAGRNSSVIYPTLVTDAKGQFEISLTDSYVGTFLLADTITLSSGGAAKGTITINYATYLPVATITMTTPDSAAAAATGIAGGTKTDIYSEGSLAGAEGGAVDVKVVLKDANGATLPAGVPVTFSVAGTGVAILSTHVTLYTDSAGSATTKVYGWVNGDRVVTATAGTVTGTGTIYFRQSAASSTGVQAEARTITATATGNLVTATVTDRFGNPISGISVVATRVGTGTFNGTSSIIGTTDVTGTVQFVLTNGTADVTVAFTSPTFAQSYATKGYVDAGITAILAYTAGTVAVAEEGVGASFDAAGVNSVTVKGVADTATVDTAQAAVDAAAEATDAANAATDAANAAAEAADAATAAAQDSADAVAALSTQVSEMISALKKQITALTNLVIKIQKKVKA